MKKLSNHILLLLILLGGCSGIYNSIPIEENYYLINENQISFSNEYLSIYAKSSFSYDKNKKNITIVYIDLTTHGDTIFLYKNYARLFQRRSWQYTNCDFFIHNGRVMDSLRILPFSSEKMQFRFGHYPATYNDTIFVEFLLGCRLSQINGLPLAIPNLKFIQVEK